MFKSEPSANTHIQFNEWTKARFTPAVGTNAGAEPLAFQNWRRFKEAFVPELVQRATQETSQALGRKARTCLDPCAGSGTTPLACQFLGVHPIAIEVNPFLADLVEAKLTPVDEALVARRCREVLETQDTVDPEIFYAGAPRTFIEPGVSGRYLFSREVASRLATLVSNIERIPEAPIARLLRVLLASAALEACNATVSGKGRRYRSNWQSRNTSQSLLDRAFIQSVEGAVFDIARFARRQYLGYELIRGDSRHLIKTIPQIDMAVFSPPYPNSFDYTDVYNIELWALRYLREATDNSALRQSTLRSHVQIKRDFQFDRTVPVIEQAIDQLRRVEALWNRNIPDMIGAYFSDLSLILAGIRDKIVDRGRVYMVVGDSRYAGVDVPVAEALKQMAPELGFTLLRSEPFRSMRSSPQQGGRAELPETLITFAAS